jgi:hypothetical protein
VVGRAPIQEVPMTRRSRLGFASVTLLALSSASVASGGPLQTPAATDAAAAAVKASPELVGSLSKEIGATPEQAAGAAGALFGVAKSRLAADQFSQIAKAVPGMDALLNAAPSGGAASGALSQVAGSASGMAAAAASFSKLGLKPDLVAKAVPVLTSLVSKSGGASVGNLLAGALK